MSLPTPRTVLHAASPMIPAVKRIAKRSLITLAGFADVIALVELVLCIAVCSVIAACGARAFR